MASQTKQNATPTLMSGGNVKVTTTAGAHWLDSQRRRSEKPMIHRLKVGARGVIRSTKAEEPEHVVVKVTGIPGYFSVPAVNLAAL